MSLQNNYSLQQLGWRTFYQQQLSLQELEQLNIGRICAQHKNRYQVLTEQGEIDLPILSSMPKLTVGDWVLLNQGNGFERYLERLTLLARKAAGNLATEQLIAANVDTMFIVSSLNQDFSLNRLERYLAIAHESGCQPVILLTKLDLCAQSTEYLEQVKELDPFLAVECIDTRDKLSCECIKPWCSVGTTIVFVGSSGVGKSTLVNTLMNNTVQYTAGIREEDSKGRHTTTSRSIHIMPSGALLLDTPGIRELQLSACESGVEETFQDIVELATQCKFADCQHDAEPNCAVRMAVERGHLDQRRVDNYLKLLREQARNGQSIAQSRSQDKAFSKMVNNTIRGKNSLRN